jgi:hypothetical protein
VSEKAGRGEFPGLVLFGEITRRRLEIIRQISFDGNVDPTALPDPLAKCLRGVKASTVEVQGYRVVFSAGLFRLVSRLHVLDAFESGERMVDPEAHEVQYRLNIRQLVVVATAAACAMAIPVSLSVLSWQFLFLAPFVWG